MWFIVYFWDSYFMDGAKSKLKQSAKSSIESGWLLESQYRMVFVIPTE